MFGILAKERKGLTGNQLKIIAMISMFIDHVGAYLFPDVLELRVIGRLAMPIFAYMIAEGCRHTKNRRKYLLQILCIGVFIQLTTFLFFQTFRPEILITFSLSIICIYSIDDFLHRKNLRNGIKAITALLFVLFTSVFLPMLISNTNFEIDYGLLGVALPVCVYFAKTKVLKLIFSFVITLLMCISLPMQLFAIFVIPLLARYNGQRGKLQIKNVFYVFYPLHILILQIIQAII